MATGPSRARAAMPGAMRPQLAVPAPLPPAGDEWLHEIKYDGYRLLARLQGGKARLFTRAGNDWTAQFPSLARSIEKIPALEAWLDGEVVFLEEDGTSSLQGLQGALGAGTDEGLSYIIFDLLFLDGKDLCPRPLRERKDALERLLAKTLEKGRLQYGSHIEGRGGEFFKAACARGLEGVVSKLGSSRYTPGRTHTWRKAKCRRAQEFVIGGYTAPRNGGEGFGALVLGVYEQGGLRYCGRVGTGFGGGKAVKGLWQRLKGLAQRETPFSPALSMREARGVRWVRPRLVVEVEFAEWTKGGVLRHASFRGLRLDKTPRSVVREYPPARALERKPGERAGKVRLTNPEKPLYPEAGLTKKDLARYYELAAPCMLPHLSGRPLTLLRCPEGWGKGCFFQKNPDAATPPQVGRIGVKEGGKAVERMFVDTPEGIIALVQMGALEIHSWGSRAGDVDSPDRMVFDLDPAPDVEWRSVVEAAFLLRELLAALGLSCFVKTTGGKGLHVAVPLEPVHEWREVAGFARAAARFVARGLPERFTSSVALRRRAGRIYIDHVRNHRGATVAEAYSTRALANAPVSAPVGWEELEKLPSTGFTLKEMARRLQRGKDPWEGYFEAARPITAEMKRRMGEKQAG